jgi:hypothetical protein
MKKGNSTDKVKKKLTQMLKLTHLQGKPGVGNKSHFNGTAHKLKAARAVKLHKLAQLLDVMKKSGHGGNGTTSGNNPRSRQAAAVSAALTKRLQGQRSLINMARRTRSGRQHSMESKLDKLKLLLSRSLQKHRKRPGSSGKTPAKQASSNGKNMPGLPIKRIQLLQQLQQQRRRNHNGRTKQRPRPGQKKPNSKVNYSYHPIMDYFGGSKPS